jgi:two-component system chemotaxis response regulator CheY
MATILIIDDEPELRATMRELLEEAGYAILEASDGQVGVHQCQEYPVDLVLTDLLMPGQDGFQTIRALRTVRPSLKIIAITGAAPMDRRDLLAFAQQVGADQTLPKPVRFAALRAAIQTLLGETERRALS